jgi:hypothetical protein
MTFQYGMTKFLPMLCYLQAIIAQVNNAIGAEGIISTECKEVVSQYGEMILELLIAQVCLLLHYSSFLPISIYEIYLVRFF